MSNDQWVLFWDVSPAVQEVADNMIAKPVEVNKTLAFLDNDKDYHKIPRNYEVYK